MDVPSSRVIDRASRAKVGRPRVASPAELERIGFELFERDGFEQTTVDDIAAAAGIGRRTFFRYFASKNDLVWGNFEEQLVYFRDHLAAVPANVPLMRALRETVVEFNNFDHDVVPWHRRRMELILRVPALRADSTLRYDSWRELITDFAAERTGVAASAPEPRLIGHLALAASITAYELWLDDESVDLSDALNATYRRLETGF
ncbi:putative TetR-family transcriptional regulator [Actinoplanes missouriensis 431]|uniref:Putative TetR-family transcriptional regulator n=1 Tax=Actinoplanes missouriensis (strain ATCC 14538 / DSM 43046 / CBS 188.64 / JCM 3121 / NBRC 102363 / NCIMB 12654 / NRRL B-3342 / UNCC 431) TaxID=512565 RepID=I0H4I4_ACTM4|nr:mycofactocin system transcriptional regulator [Actinoplanes missouriensis]BAL87921.1 putative TetR-family transcriptional regulator [Actinoplanes missouriensis 431]